MQKHIVRKGLVVGIILLFVGASISSGFDITSTDNSQPSSRGWLYVGGSGPGNYTTIQSAINAANPGDTVFVYSGTYYENMIYINKTINLIGEDRSTTIIDGLGYNDVILINANWVNISELTINHRGSGGYDYCLDIYSSYNTIQDCDIYGKMILKASSNYCNIIGNSIFYKTLYINSAHNIIQNNTFNSVDIVIDDGDWNLIKNNILDTGDISLKTRSNYNKIFNNRVGGRIGLVESAVAGNNDFNEIINNYIEHKTPGGIGIGLYADSDNNKIINNTIINTSYGIFITGWINTGSDNNFIEGNTIYSNYMGIYVHFSCLNQTLRNNSLFHSGIKASDSNHYIDSSNTVNGKPIYFYYNMNNITVPSDAGEVILIKSSNFTISNLNINDSTLGIYLENSNNNIISNNSITNQTWKGVYLSSSNNNVVTNNVVNEVDCPGGNFAYGIYLYYSSNNNTVYENYLSNCHTYGVYASHGSADNKIYHNNFKNNNVNGRDTSNNIWDNGYPSGGNYWDDYSGSDNDGDGIGDTPYYIPGGSNQDNYPLMTLYGPPHAAFTFIFTGLSVFFNASTSYDYNGNITLYSWDFGDGTNGTGKLTNHIYPNYGLYNVILTVTDNDGNTDSISKIVNINDPPVFGSPSPTNGSTGQSLSFNWSIPISDPEGDSFDWTIQCSNGQTSSGTNATNETKTLSLSGLTYSTTYIVWVNATDPDGSNQYTRAWYTFTTETENFPPVFGTPTPSNGSTNQPLSLAWSIPISDTEGDLFSWTIECSNGQTNSGSGATNGTKTLALSGLSYSTTYKVWVNATDPTGSGQYTRRWYTFTTANQPPNKPERPTGETNGKINTPYMYTTSTTDPDADQVYYLWDWGDGSQSTWLGPYDSGAEATAEHTWTTKGDYSIKVKAKDTSGAESDWSDPLAVTMPYSYNPIRQFFERFFQWFPNAFPILRHLMGY